MESIDNARKSCDPMSYNNYLGIANNYNPVIFRSYDNTPIHKPRPKKFISDILENETPYTYHKKKPTSYSQYNIPSEERHTARFSTYHEEPYDSYYMRNTQFSANNMHDNNIQSATLPFSNYKGPSTHSYLYNESSRKPTKSYKTPTKKVPSNGLNQMSYNDIRNSRFSTEVSGRPFSSGLKRDTALKNFDKYYEGLTPSTTLNSKISNMGKSGVKRNS